MKTNKTTKKTPNVDENQKIELTEAQIQEFSKYVDKWNDIGMKTGPCDFEKAKQAAKAAYKAAGLAEPTEFFHFTDPLTAAIGSVLAQMYLDKEMKGNEYVPEETGNYYVGAVNSAVKQLKPQLPKDAKLCFDIKSKEFWSHVHDEFYNQIYGNQESWLMFHDFFINHCDIRIKSAEKLEALIDMANYCGWWSPLEGMCVFQDRFMELHRDDQGRLHNLNGPAIKYAGDGFSDVYAVHNVKVTKEIIEGKFTANDIENEKNAEIRRIMIDIFGAQRYLLETKMEKVHEDKFGILYKKDIPGDESIMIVEVINSTPEPDGTFKHYHLRVDPNAYGGLKTAQAAVASTWRKKGTSELVFANPEDYDPEIET